MRGTRVLFTQIQTDCFGSSSIHTRKFRCYQLLLRARFLFSDSHATLVCHVVCCTIVREVCVLGTSALSLAHSVQGVAVCVRASERVHVNGFRARRFWSTVRKEACVAVGVRASVQGARLR